MNYFSLAGEMGELLRELMRQRPGSKPWLISAVIIVPAVDIPIYFIGRAVFAAEHIAVSTIAAIIGVSWFIYSTAMLQALLPPRRLLFGGEALDFGGEAAGSAEPTVQATIKDTTASAANALPKSSEKDLQEIAAVARSLRELEGYYTINKSQAISSYRLGVFLVSIGVVILGLGIGSLYLGLLRNVTTTALTAVASIVVQLMGAYQLYIARGTQDQTRYFYGRLAELQRTLVAGVLVPIGIELVAVLFPLNRTLGPFPGLGVGRTLPWGWFLLVIVLAGTAITLRLLDSRGSAVLQVSLTPATRDEMGLSFLQMAKDRPITGG